jgi:methenyltetrahydrofolate cyclohydrolase
MADDFTGDSLAIFLDRIASEQAAPGGGAAAATAVAMAAGLVGMSARLSHDKLDESAALAARADALRARAAPLAQADARAYGRVLEAYRMPKSEDPRARREEIANALSAAAEIPLEVAEIAAEVASLGVGLAENGNANLKGDSIAATLLAEAGARSAAVLVAINLRDNQDHRRERAEKLATSASAAARRAVAAIA